DEALEPGGRLVDRVRLDRPVQLQGDEPLRRSLLLVGRPQDAVPPPRLGAREDTRPLRAECLPHGREDRRRLLGRHRAHAPAPPTISPSSNAACMRSAPTHPSQRSTASSGGSGPKYWKIPYRARVNSARSAHGRTSTLTARP